MHVAQRCSLACSLVVTTATTTVDVSKTGKQDRWPVAKCRSSGDSFTASAERTHSASPPPPARPSRDAWSKRAENVVLLMPPATAAEGRGRRDGRGRIPPTGIVERRYLACWILFCPFIWPCPVSRPTKLLRPHCHLLPGCQSCLHSPSLS